MFAVFSSVAFKGSSDAKMGAAEIARTMPEINRCLQLDLKCFFVKNSAVTVITLLLSGLENMDKTKEKILKSVKRCQGLYGLKKMTMEDVANQANLSRQTVYEKFGSKKKLVAAFFSWLGQETLDVVAYEMRREALENEISMDAAVAGIN